MTSNQDRRHVEVINMGVGTPHPAGHVSSTPQGFAYYAVLCFQTPFVSLTGNGRETGNPGDCLVFAPRFPQWHTNLPEAERGFRNDWCHVAAPGLDRLLEPHAFPLNTIIPSGNPALLTDDLTAIRNELWSDFPLKHAVIDNHMEAILIKLSRAYISRTELAPYSPAESQYYDRFVEIREVVTARASESWTVKGMARMANLGSNRFSALYRRFFEASPIEDLITARIELAKYHLLASNATLETIADGCGFSNVYYFSKCFKKRVGTPPGKYRLLREG